MLISDLIYSILEETDPISYYKIINVSKGFHIHLTNENAMELYLKRKYGGYSLQDLIDKGDVEGVKYKVDNDPNNIYKYLINITANNIKNIGEILSILQNKDTHKCKIKLTYKSKIKKTEPVVGGSGFAFGAKKTLSTELCTFLEVPENTQLSCIEVTKRLWVYIKAHNLQDPANRRIIFPDAKLGALLNVPQGGTLTIFNLYSYYSVHMT